MDPKQMVSILAEAALFLSVASFGLQARAADVFRAMCDAETILKGVIAVNIVVPIAAVTVCLLLSIDPVVETGIIVMAVSPLAPLAPGKMGKLGLETSAVVGLYVALIVLAVFIVPLTVAGLSALFPADASISVAAVGKLVGMTILLPIALGIAAASFAPRLAAWAARITAIVGFAGVLLLLVLIAYVQRGAAAGLAGDGTLLAIVVTVTAGIVAGHLLGRPDPAYSNALAMAAAIRHPGIAILIAQANFADRRITLTVVLFLITSVLVTAVYQRLPRAWLGAPSGTAAAE